MSAASQASVDKTVYDDQVREKFDVEVGLDDFNPKFPTIGVLGLSGASLFYLALFVANGSLLVGLVALTAGLFVSVLIYRFVSFKSRIVNKMPGMLGRRRGFVSSQRLFIQQPYQESEFYLSALSEFANQPKSLVLTFSSNRMISIILPKRGFAGEAAAEQAADIVNHRFSTNQPVPRTIFDARLSSDPDYPCPTPPEGAIKFNGPVYLRDTAGTAFMRIRNSTLVRIALTLALACGFIVGLSIMMDVSWPLVLFIFVVFVMLIGRRFLVTVRSLMNLDTSVYKMRGWVHESGIETCISFGRVRYGWPRFMSLEVTNDSLSLALSQFDKHYLIIARSQFESAEAWETAKQLVSENMASPEV